MHLHVRCHQTHLMYTLITLGLISKVIMLARCDLVNLWSVCCVQVKSTNFSSTVDMQLLLDSLYRTFTEFKSHEQIENKLIMRKLRSKIRNNEAVCNCHKVHELSLCCFHFIVFTAYCVLMLTFAACRHKK